MKDNLHIAIEKEVEAYNVNKEYFSEILREMPRFKAKGMNQAELIHHVFSIGFHRGWKASEQYTKKTN